MLRHPAALAALVGAGAEPAAGAGEHDRADVVVDGELPQPVPQRHHDVERHRVHPLGQVERDEGDAGRRSVDQHVIHARQYVGTRPPGTGEGPDRVVRALVVPAGRRVAAGQLLFSRMLKLAPRELVAFAVAVS